MENQLKDEAKKITCRLITEQGHYSAAYTYRTNPEQIGNVNVNWEWDGNVAID